MGFRVRLHLHRAVHDVDVDDLPGPVGDGLLHVVEVFFARLAPVLIPRGAAGDHVIDRPVARLAARVQVMVTPDVQHVLLRGGEDRHPRIAEFLRDVADVLLGLIGVVQEADDPVDGVVGIRRGRHVAQPGFLSGIGAHAVQVDEQHAADLVRVVALVRRRLDALVRNAVVVEVRAIQREVAVVVELVVAHGRHDRQVGRDRRGHLEVHLLVLLEGAHVDLVADVDDEVHRRLDRLAIQRFQFGLRRAHQLLVAVVRDDLVVAHHQEADVPAVRAERRLRPGSGRPATVSVPVRTR